MKSTSVDVDKLVKEKLVIQVKAMHLKKLKIRLWAVKQACRLLSFLLKVDFEVNGDA